MSGGDLKDAKEMIGHSDISMTDRYSHISVGHIMRRQDQLAAHYEEGLSNLILSRATNTLQNLDFREKSKKAANQETS
jgi:site-specific recombinase XerC